MRTLLVAAGFAAIASCADAPRGADRPRADTVVAVPQPLPAAPTLDAPPFDAALLQGTWSADGENFTWVVEQDSILFEIDMLRHPFTIRRDTLLIDRGDPAIGIQKTRVLRVTADSLRIQDVLAGTSETLIRLR